MTNTNTKSRQMYRVTCCGTYIDECGATSAAQAVRIVARRFPRLVRASMAARMI